MDAIYLGGDRALVASNRGLTLVDTSALTVSGTQRYLFRLMDLNARNVYAGDNGLVYVNLNRGETRSSHGLAVVRVAGDRLETVRIVEEEGVLFEKMCLSGGYLYVAAHSDGLIVYSLADPERPVLAGRLGEGLTDAWAVDVRGDTAYVADGAGGLKVVDVTDKSSPVLIMGEDATSALGTAHDVVAGARHVYLAAGGAGVVCYQPSSLTRLWRLEPGGIAKHVRLVDDFLAVATFNEALLLSVADDGTLGIAARERLHRRDFPQQDSILFRSCMAVAPAGAGRLLATGFNTVELFEYRPLAESLTPDIWATVERVHFPVSGGTVEARVANLGGAPLAISGVGLGQAPFSTTLTPMTLGAGQEASFTITFAGSLDEARDMLRIVSNDPDESTLPIQLFGRTEGADVGEAAPVFSLPMLTRNARTGTNDESTFDLAQATGAGKVVWFHVYSTL